MLSLSLGWPWPQRQDHPTGTTTELLPKERGIPQNKSLEPTCSGGGQSTCGENGNVTY
jgi:hypothetical protein